MTTEDALALIHTLDPNNQGPRHPDTWATAGARADAAAKDILEQASRDRHPSRLPA